MKIFIEYSLTTFPPCLSLYIHGAPHRRVPISVLQDYRAKLKTACDGIGLTTPLWAPIDLKVTFVDPTSPDLDNLLTALYRALDGKSLKGPGILVDDGLIHRVTMLKFFPNARKRGEPR